jgi:RNA polymerase sigma-70 factor (ECF subfamily)
VLVGLRSVLVPVDPAGARHADLGPTLTRGLTLLALRVLGTADDAEEAVQEILARALEAIRAGRVPDDVPLSAFVYGIARHVLADACRRRRKERTHVDSDLTPLAAAQSSPLESLIRQEERDQVSWALAHLPAEDRRLLTRCFLEGESTQDIAERSGVPAERLRKRKSRALKRLRALLAGRFGHAFSPAPTSVA